MHPSATRHIRTLQIMQVCIALAMAFCSGTSRSAGEKAEPPDVKVGDRWKTVQSDKRSGKVEAEVQRVVTAVAQGVIEGTENAGTFRMTTELNPIESVSTVVTGDPRFLNFPLEVGKKWTLKYSFANKTNQGKGRVEGEVEVTAFEKVSVKVGTFDAFRIEAKSFWNNDTTRANGRSKSIYWYSPAAKTVVRTEYEDGYNNWVRELVELRLQP